MKSIILLINIIALAFLSCNKGFSQFEVSDLTCEYLKNPIGIDILAPRLSWKLTSGERGQKQTAYRVLVASSEAQLADNTGDLWDTGKIESGQSVHIEYNGKPLQSRMQCYWKVMLWDADGKSSDWSEPATWTMGLLAESDWQAKWICPKQQAPEMQGDIKVVEASYGTADGKTSVNVTKLVKALVKEGRMEFRVQSKHLGGDPAKGREKELKVKYEWKNKVYYASAFDFQTLKLPEIPYGEKATPYLRRTFTLESTPEEALAYVNVKGYYELYVNGQKVGDDVLSPAVSDLGKHLFYRTYDIRSLLQSGENCVGLWLARGWNKERPIARAQLDITANGKHITIGTDKNWLFSPSSHSRLGAWRWGDMGGERVDARKAISNWSEVGCDTSKWFPVLEVDAPKAIVTAQPSPPNQIGEVLPLVKTTALGKNTWELDFGTNLSGWFRIQFPKLKAGQQVTMHYGDKRYQTPKGDDTPAGKIRVTKPYTVDTPDGPVVYQEFNQRDEFISAGKSDEEFCSKFNYHGFRYVVVEGLYVAPKPEDVEALLVETALEPVGTFSSSNELFNQIHTTNLWTLRSLNAGSYMVDCPHRERWGYGDGQVGIESMIMNRDAAAFYSKWAVDWLETQNLETGDIAYTAPTFSGSGGGPGWGGVACVIPYKLYQYYGDTRLLEQAYEPTRRYLEFFDSKSEDDIFKKYGGKWDFLGDWVPPRRGMDTSNWPSALAAELFNNCYRLYLWQILEHSARVLGKTEDEKKWAARIAELQSRIHEVFYDVKNKQYQPDEQSYQLMPLMTGVVPDELQGTIRKKLEDLIVDKNAGHLDTGMFGTYFLIQYLQQIDRNDLLHTIFNQESYPGWGYMLSQGATTFWEQWNGYYSHIHSCFTSPGGWFYQGLGGIRPDETEPGFKKIMIKPAIVGDLDWVKTSYNSIHGKIVSNWTRKGETLTMEVVVPPNTTATVYVPATNIEDVTESGKKISEAEGVTFKQMENGKAVFEVESGSYQFTSN